MHSTKPTLLVLAAGMGSRFGGLKQVTPVGPSQETIIEYSIYDALRAGFGKVVFVIRKNFSRAFKEKFDPLLDGKMEVAYVYQELENLPRGFSVPGGREKPWGTAHAVLMGKEAIHEPFAAINADDFYGSGAFRIIADFLLTSTDKNEYAMVGYTLKNTLSDYGSVSRGVCEVEATHTLKKITEQTSIHRTPGGIVAENNKQRVPLTGEETVSMNFWGFKPSLFEYLEDALIDFLQKKSNEPKAEIYIPSVVFDLIGRNRVKVKVLPADASWFGVTYKEEQPYVMKRIRSLVNQGIYPENLWKK
jgi:UTP-glucose-1-phosphate uridylyltransferase